MTPDDYYQIFTFESTFETCFKFILETSGANSLLSLLPNENTVSDSLTINTSLSERAYLEKKWGLSEDVIPLVPWLWEQNKNSVKISVAFTAEIPLKKWVTDNFLRYGKIAKLSLDYYSEEDDVSGFITNHENFLDLKQYEGFYLNSRMLTDQEILDELTKVLFPKSENTSILDWRKSITADGVDCWHVEIGEVIYICGEDNNAFNIDFSGIPKGFIYDFDDFPFQNRYSDFIKLSISKEHLKVDLTNNPVESGEDYKTRIIASIISEDSLAIDKVSWEEDLIVLDIYNKLRKEHPKADEKELFEDAYYRFKQGDIDY